MEYQNIPTCCANTQVCQQRYGPDCIYHKGQCVRLMPDPRNPWPVEAAYPLLHKEVCRLKEGASEKPCWVPPPYESISLGGHCYVLAPIVPHDFWYKRNEPVVFPPSMIGCYGQRSHSGQ